MPQHYSWIKVILVNKVNLKRSDDYDDDVSNSSRMIAILLIEKTIKVNNTEHLLHVQVLF